ncbi:hypothetical protein H1R16_04555 [Marnyiella aurantia]|uniref:Uncharacterized protein n=1 Tax=Marnyiella aurantia TaxID=2758037 RepID=A0A7D7LNN3_9FLAO|nr:hypothetical protein [Marnyiella aurantia]MBA5247529.1 hypothetical protein [Marnyiella aurantia]QMS99282.1 hypothetical protein H1R16_04555 [Marnyiella aurantia]
MTARTFSGDSLILQNPYSVTNMEDALQKIKDENPDFPIRDFAIQETHRYLKFKPNTEEEVGLLKQDSTIHYFDYRMDCEYAEGFLENRVPDADSISVYYTAVPIGKALPNVDYEVLSHLYIPEQDAYFDAVENMESYPITNVVDNTTDLFYHLLYNAFAQTGNEEELLAEPEPNARGLFSIFATKWYPSGNIKVNDDVAGVKPVTGAQVLMRQWFTVRQGITDGNGNFSTGDVRGKARYVIQWERHNYSVRDGSFFQAETHGPNVKQQSWHTTISGGKDEYHSLIHQAAHDFYYGNRFALISPPINNHFYNFGKQTQIKIAGRLSNSGPTSSYSHLRSEITFGLSAQVHIKDYGKPSDQVYGTTIHELSHALHSVKDRSSYNDIVQDSFLSGNTQVRKRNRRLLESWPTAVEILMTLERYKVRYNITNYSVYSNYQIINYQKRKISEENLYTSGIYDMTDEIDQRRIYGSEYPIDQVKGYTIKELENALSGARYWNDYRDKVKAMYPNKPTRPFIDELFANWQD